VKSLRHHKIQSRENRDGYLFILPSLLFFLIFIIFPFFFGFYLSLNEKTGARLLDISFAGFSQFKRALSEPQFFNSLKNTLIYTFSVVFFQLIIGLFSAVILNRKIKGKDIIRVLVFIPVVIPTIVAGTVWTWMYSPDMSGLINRAVGLFGIRPIAWLRDPHWAMFSIILMSVWKWIGYFMVIYLAALQDIPDDYYEASQLDGANSFQQFNFITLPLLKNVTWLLIITSIINSFQVFDQIYVMTKGGPIGTTSVLVYYIYDHAFTFFNLTYASAVAWLMFSLIFLITLAQFIIQQKQRK
jgi:multiple sugar transport system permease protein